MACGNHPTSNNMSQIRASIQLGKAMHYSVRASFLQSDPRAEGAKTFTTEKAITNSKGEVVRFKGRRGQPDKVDYRRNEIFDVKPMHKGETPEDVYYRNLEQFERYSKIYERARRTTPTIHLLCYEAD